MHRNEIIVVRAVKRAEFRGPGPQNPTLSPVIIKLTLKMACLALNPTQPLYERAKIAWAEGFVGQPCWRNFTTEKHT